MQEDIKELKTMVRAIINGQSSMKAELLTKIESSEKKIDTRISSLEKETRKGFKEVNNRIDLLGKELFNLSEDAPTGDEFRDLEKRVDRLEKYQNFITV